MAEPKRGRQTAAGAVPPPKPTTPPPPSPAPGDRCGCAAERDAARRTYRAVMADQDETLQVLAALIDAVGAAAGGAPAALARIAELRAIEQRAREATTVTVPPVGGAGARPAPDVGSERDRLVSVIEEAMPADTVWSRDYGTVGIAPDVGDLADALLADGWRHGVEMRGPWLDVVFDGPPSHFGGRFVEVEDEHRRSVNVGEWIDRGDGFWALRIARPVGGAGDTAPDDPVVAVVEWMEREAAELAAEVGRTDERGAAVTRAIVQVVRAWAGKLRDALAARTTTPPDGVAAMLAEFHDAFGQPFGHGSVDASDLRVSLHKEEQRELLDAYTDRDLTAIAHELADVVYVAYGSAHSLGIPLDEVIGEVHRANMSKFGEDGRPVLRADGKVMKGPRYRAPDVAAVLAGRTATPPPAEPAEALTVPRDLLVSLVDDDPCWYDHHGGCQAHGYLSLKPGEVCPHAEAKELLGGTTDDEETTDA